MTKICQGPNLTPQFLLELRPGGIEAATGKMENDAGEKVFMRAMKAEASSVLSSKIFFPILSC